jgi:hypothetical protein
MITIAFYVLALTAQVSDQPVAAPPSETYLSEARDPARSPVDTSILSGRDADGRTFAVKIRRSSSGVSVEAVLSNKKIGRVVLSERQYQKIDILSVFVGAPRSGAIEISLKFGASRNCYMNDDGRSRVTILFLSAGRPTISPPETLGC